MLTPNSKPLLIQNRRKVTSLFPLDNLLTQKHSKTTTKNEVQLQFVSEDDEEYRNKEVTALGIRQKIIN